MANVQLRHKSTKTCLMCGKGDTMAFNRPNSLHKSKKVVKPNIQVRWGLEFCQNCFRTLQSKGLDLAKESSRKPA